MANVENSEKYTYRFTSEQINEILEALFAKFLLKDMIVDMIEAGRVVSAPLNHQEGGTDGKD